MSSLTFTPVIDAPHLVGAPVAMALGDLPGDVTARIQVAPIDPALADTDAFCAAYDQRPEASANCIVVAGRRGGVTTYAACVVLATTRADVNGTARRLLDARRMSFAPMDEAVSLTGMEYGGITPIGLPASWRVLVDTRIHDVPLVIIGAGIRGAKLFLPGSVLCGLPYVEVVEQLAKPSE